MLGAQGPSSTVRKYVRKMTGKKRNINNSPRGTLELEQTCFLGVHLNGDSRDGAPFPRYGGLDTAFFHVSTWIDTIQLDLVSHLTGLVQAWERPFSIFPLSSSGYYGNVIMMCTHGSLFSHASSSLLLQR